MVRRRFSPGVVLAVTWFALGAGLALATAGAEGPSDEDPRIVVEFLQGLRERGYYDLATEYIEAVRKQADAPLALKETAEYELGRLLLDEAAKTGDLVRRKDLLEEARAKLDTFTRANPKHPKAPEALVELARLLVERGHLAMLQADETENKADKESKLTEARGSFDQARTAYAGAEDRLKADFEKYPKTFIADKEVRDEKARTHTALMNARLQRAVVDYEQGQTYPPGSKERGDLLGKALEQFDGIRKDYRTQLAGLTARMMQGKCYEERGELGPAMGVYNELMEHAAPELRKLQRHVGYYRIIVLGKRKEYALAADEAARWVRANDTPEALRSPEGLGVQLELAKNILAQLPSIDDEKDKAAAVKTATERLGLVVRYASPYKPEAIDLLRKYKPRAAAAASDVAKLSYDEALSAGEQAIAGHEWDRGAALMRQAVRKAEAVKDADKTNFARYQLAFCYYMDKRFYEAFVVCDHLARRYPRGGLSPKAAEMGMVALNDAYDPKFSPVDRTTDINNLVDLAKYTAETYPELDQGDAAKLILGQIYHGTGRYDEAVKAFESVRPKSAKSVEARTYAGGSYWKKSQVLRDGGKAAEAEAEQNKAVASLRQALKARQDSGTAPTDPALVNNACDLADIDLATDKPAEALALLDPILKAQKPPHGPAYARLVSDVLRAHIGTNQVDLAITDMGTLEAAGGGGAELYFRLGKLLEKEMDALKTKGDSAGLSRTQSAYQKFLSALVASKSGQTFDSLYWAGQNMLTLAHPKEAQAVFDQILKAYKDDPKFLAQPGSADRLMLTRLKLAASLRGQGDFEGAATLIDEASKDYPRAIEVLMEKGMLLEDKAAASRSAASWGAAFRQWQDIALRLSKIRTKPVEYYDAWYHAALALNQEGKAKEARQTLAGIMRLSPAVGGPEMKRKYKTLLEQIK